MIIEFWKEDADGKGKIIDIKNWDTVPRKGEFINLKKRTYIVTNVYYWHSDELEKGMAAIDMEPF